MKQLIIVIASLLSCVFFASLASAQALDESSNNINGDTNTTRTMSNEEAEALSVKNAMEASGWEINIGIGYCMIASFDLRLTGGYHFGVESLDGLSFGLYGELGGQLGFPMSVTFDVVPMMHVHGESFRVSFGFGLGMFYFSDGYEDEGSQGRALFEMRPEIRFDWFLSEHILIGVEAAVPLLLITNAVDNHSIADPWFTFDIYFGYRF